MAAIIVALVRTANLRKTQHELQQHKDSNVESPEPGLRRENTASLSRADLRRHSTWRALRRRPLVERLRLEQKLRYGLVQLTLWCCTFLFIYCLGFDSKSSRSELGIHQMVYEKFELDSLPEVVDLASLWDYIENFIEHARDFAVNGNPYFPDTQQLQLVGKQTTFARPKPLSSLIDPKLTQSFSFVAWVSADFLLTKGYVVRKYVPEATTSCWAWRYPGQFRFGSHDFGLADPSREHIVRSDWQTASTGTALEAIVVNGTHVVFYSESKGYPIVPEAYPLPRAVTDCRGILAVGDADLTITDLRVYPYALTEEQMAEIHNQGSTLEDLVMSTVPSAPDTDDIDLVLHRLDAQQARLYQEITKDFTALQLRNIRARVIQEAAAAAANASAATAVASASPHGLAQGLSANCTAGSPCRVEVADAATGRALPASSGLTLVAASEATICANAPGLAATATAGLTNPMAAAAECGSGPKCVAQLRAQGTWSVGRHAFDLGVPTSGGAEFHLCWSPDYTNASVPATHVGTLSLRSDPGHVVVQPDAPLGPEWHRFPRPVAHTRRHATGSNFSLAFWAQLKFGEATLERKGHEVALPLIRMTHGLDNEGVVCWTAKVYRDRMVYFGAAHTTDGQEEAQCDIPSLYHLATRDLRHVAFVWGDPGSLTMYLDGERLCHFPRLHHNTADLHCDNPYDAFMTFNSEAWFENHTTPHPPSHGLYELGANVYEPLFFPNEALTGAQVKELATHHRAECHDITKVHDTLFEDAAGHGCDWYRLQIVQGSSPETTCDAAARQACPLACNVAALCFPGEGLGSAERVEGHKRIIDVSVARAQPYVLWDRVRKLEAQALCPSSAVHRDGAGRAALLAECAAGAPAHGLYRWADVYKAGQAGNAPNLTDCAALSKWYSAEDCEFNGTQVRAWARRVQETQAFTIAFWAKGPFFIHFMNRIQPTVGLASFSLGEDKEFVVQALTHPNGDPACPGAKAHVARGYSSGREAAEEWDFYVFQAYHDPAEGPRARLFAGGAMSYAGVPFGQFCVSDIEGIVFESLTEALVSPISLYPRAIPVSEIYLHYYDELAQYRLYTPGPLRKDHVQNAPILRESPNYPLWALAITPPIAFTTRYASEPCRGVSHRVLQRVAAEAAIKCGGRYACGTDYVRDPEALFACRNEMSSPAQFLGSDPIELGGRKGFVEVLQMFDNPILKRNGTVIQPNNFIDVLTEMLSITQLYLSPKWPGGLLNTVSILKVTVDTKYGVQAKAKLVHLPIFDEERLAEKRPLMVLSLVSLSLLMLYSVYLCDRRRRYSPVYTPSPEFVTSLFDIGLCICCMVYVILYWSAISHSETATGQPVGTMTGIAWHNRSVEFGTKVRIFFDSLNALETEALYYEQLQTLALILMFLCLLRLVASISVHPRVSLITGTLVHSGDDLAHFVFTFLIIFVALAALGTWSFGDELNEYNSLGATFMTQWSNMISGTVPEGYGDNWRLGLYGFIFVIIAFLLLLNFLLAIIVEAYIKVKEAIERQETENSFPTDVVCVLIAQFLQWRYRWPHYSKITQAIVEAGTDSDEEELVAAEDLPIFATKESWESFYQFYSVFNWALLEKRSVTQVHPSPKSPPSGRNKGPMSAKTSVQLDLEGSLAAMRGTRS